MRITPKQYASSLYESVTSKDKKEIGQIISNFVQVLVKNNDTLKLESIIAQFNKIWNEKNGIVDAEIVTALSVSDATIKLIKNYIAKITGAEKVVITQKEDKKILGGVIVKYQDKVLDGSIKTRIKNLKNKMVK